MKGRERRPRQRRFDVDPRCGCLWDRHPGLTHEEWSWLLDLECVVEQFRKWNEAERPVDLLADELERMAAVSLLRQLQVDCPLQETFSEQFLEKHRQLSAALREEVERFSERHRRRFHEAIERERLRIPGQGG